MKLSKADYQILDSYKTFLEGLGAYLGEGYEIVLHSLENYDQSAIKVINGFHSGRKEGAPITNLALEMLSQINEKDSAPYMIYINRSSGGDPIKSTTIPVIGQNNRIIGLICINFYFSSPVSSLLSTFLGLYKEEPKTLESFSSHSDELIKTTLEEVKKKVYENSSISFTNKNKEILHELQDRGIFNLKDSVAKVAEALGISKNTVYLHLRNRNS